MLFAGVVLAGCSGDGDGQPPVSDSAYYNILVTQAAGLVTDLLTIYGDLPASTTNTLVAVREYGEGVCDVVLDGASPDTLIEPRAKLDVLYADFLAAQNDPVVTLAVRRGVSTARQLSDLALAQNADPEAFRQPCATLRGLPEILPRA